MNNRSFIIVAILNIIIACSAQVFYWSLLDETIDLVWSQFVVFPLVIGLINILLGVSKFRIAFFQHSLAAYLAFFVSIVVSLFMILDPSKELPPGEIILFSDVLFIALLSIFQLLVLLVLHLFIYIVYRVFTSFTEQVHESR